MGRSPEYNAWVNMRQRCMNTSHPEYNRYGGRGITICERWLHSYQNFIDDVGFKMSDELSLERIDNPKGYCKENCKWGTKSEQSFNQRLSSDNRSGFKGVYKEKQTRKWKAYIRVNGRQITIGRYADMGAAVEARKLAEYEFYKERP